jgi:hypothetical protein
VSLTPITRALARSLSPTLHLELDTVSIIFDLVLALDVDAGGWVDREISEEFTEQSIWHCVWRDCN